MLGQVQDQLAARARPAGLDEAQVSRRHVGLAGKVELAHPPLMPPLSQEVTDSAGWGHDAHASTVTAPDRRRRYVPGNRTGSGEWLSVAGDTARNTR
jgi:hypothetical protein